MHAMSRSSIFWPSPSTTIARSAALQASRRSSPVDLAGWGIVSTQGNQAFSFPSGPVLRAGEALTVVSGPRANHLRTGEVAWSTQHIWRNAGDPGQLINAQGRVIATSP